MSPALNCQSGIASRYRRLLAPKPLNTLPAMHLSDFNMFFYFSALPLRRMHFFSLQRQAKRASRRYGYNSTK